MIFWKLIALLSCLVAFGNSMPVEPKEEPDYGPVHYEFSYSVNDPKTGDIKSQKESRKDDKVEGSYELIDSDGYRRLVQYKADDKNGFEAVVLREPTSIKIPLPEAQKHIEHPAKLLIAKPVHLVHSEPAHKLSESQVSYSGPLIHYRY